jgi:hypothetical protein
VLGGACPRPSAGMTRFRFKGHRAAAIARGLAVSQPLWRGSPRLVAKHAGRFAGCQIRVGARLRRPAPPDRTSNPPPSAIWVVGQFESRLSTQSGLLIVTFLRMVNHVNRRHPGVSVAHMIEIERTLIQKTATHPQQQSYSNPSAAYL